MEKKIIVPENSYLEIMEEPIPDDGVLSVSIEVGQGARVVYMTQAEHGDRSAILSRKAIVQKNAEIIWFDMYKSTAIISSEIITQLVGAGARAETYGIFYGKKNSEITISHRTEHMASDTHTIMETKGVLDDKSRANVNSLIKIFPSMIGCTGHERADTLILSRNAHIDAVPSLEIGNNDVRCTHAVTTTRLNPEKLFYLEGRGIVETDAVFMLISAHYESILQKIPDDLIAMR